jgi:hypothetical protein
VAGFRRDSTEVVEAMGFLALAGAFGLCAVFALVGARSAAQWHDRRRLWQLLGISIALLVSTGIALWAGIRYPNASLSHGFGPDWECAIDTRPHSLLSQSAGAGTLLRRQRSPNGCDAV